MNPDKTAQSPANYKLPATSHRFGISLDRHTEITASVRLMASVSFRERIEAIISQEKRDRVLSLEGPNQSFWLTGCSVTGSATFSWPNKTTEYCQPGKPNWTLDTQNFCWGSITCSCMADLTFITLPGGQANTFSLHFLDIRFNKIWPVAPFTDHTIRA